MSLRWHRIWGSILRYIFLSKHSFARFTDAFYYTTIDLLVWGIMSSYFKLQDPAQAKLATVIISAVAFWYIIYIAQNEIGANLLEDFHNRNLVNLFVTPLKFSEWVLGFIIMATLKSLIAFGFVSLLAFWIFQVTIFIYGWYLLPFYLCLVILGWSIGLLVGGLILRLGSKMGSMAWAVAFIIYPFSAVYYPLQALPEGVQKIALLLPSTHIFEGVREIVMTGNLDPNKIYLSFLLGILYLLLGLFFFYRSFKKVLDKGLVKIF